MRGFCPSSDGVAKVPRVSAPAQAAAATVSERVFGPMDGSSSGLSGLQLRPEQVTEPNGRTDRVSVAALVTGILGLAPVAIALGIVGLLRTKKPGVHGRRYAQAGLALGIFWAVGMVAVLLFALVVGQSLGGSSADATDAAGTVDSAVDTTAQDGTTKSGSEVEQGDCLLAWDATTLTPDVDPDHQAQAFGEVDLSDAYPDGAAFPGETQVVDAGTAACRTQVPTALADSAQSLAVSAIPPTEADWANGARTVMCLTVSGAADLTASVVV
jgi:hypothetical protein